MVETRISYAMLTASALKKPEVGSREWTAGGRVIWESHLQWTEQLKVLGVCVASAFPWAWLSGAASCSPLGCPADTLHSASTTFPLEQIHVFKTSTYSSPWLFALLFTWPVKRPLCSESIPGTGHINMHKLLYLLAFNQAHSLKDLFLVLKICFYSEEWK